MSIPDLNIVSRKEKKISTPNEPVLKVITPDTISDLTVDEIKELKERSENGYAKKHFEEITNLLDNVRTIDAVRFTPDVDLRVSETDVTNTFAFMDAIAYKMYLIFKEFSSSNVFFEVDCQLKDESDEKDGKVKFEKVTSKVNPLNLANYLYNAVYRNRLFKSHANSGTKKRFYVYDECRKRWFDGHGKSLISNEIMRHVITIVRKLGITSYPKGFNKKAVAKQVLLLVDTIEDEEQSAIISWTLKNPNLVQFKDMVYDIEKHAIAKMSPKFMLCNYHDYRLPIKSVKLNELTEEDGFIPLKETIAEMEEKSQLILERISLLTKEKEFITTVIGNGFCHNDDFTVFPILEGDTALGKSWFFNVLTKYLYGLGNVSYVTQYDLGRSSKRYNSSTFGEEFNLMGDMFGVVMNQRFVEFIKLKTNSENGQQFGLNNYVQMLGLATSGQTPVIPKKFNDDDDIKRRIVRIKCNDRSKINDDLDTEKFTKVALIKEMPYFALFSMMKLQQHKDNGNVLKFMYEVDGASKHPIDGFTSQDMVDSTVSYFKQQKRV